MNKRVFKKVTTFWWVPFTLINLVLLGIFYREKSVLISEQRKVVTDFIATQMSIEESFNVNEPERKFATKMPKFEAYCHSGNRVGFFIFFNDDKYYIGKVTNKMNTNDFLNYISESGHFRVTEFEIILQADGRPENEETSKVLKILKLSKKTKIPNELYYYGEVLVRGVCTKEEMNFMNKVLTP